MNYNVLNDTHCVPLTDENFTLNTTEHTIESVVHVSCKDGYRLQGNEVLVCYAGGTWSSLIPRCLEETKSTPILIVVVSTLASVVALFILGCALYMLLKNCRKEQEVKKEEELYEAKIKELSNYFASNQDCVGMPPLVFDNVDPTMRGRCSSSTASSISQGTSPTQGDEDQDSNKVFVY